MKAIRCRLGKRSYSIYVKKNALAHITTFLKQCGIRGNVLVVTNRRIYNLYFVHLKKCCRKAPVRLFYHILPDGEEAKSEKHLFALYNKLLTLGFDRHATIIAFGGGVIGDVSGFCASTYMRGINFITIPTTVLAQVDSAIGGKTAINLPRGKNLIGTFYQPHCVISDVSLLSSLTKAQRADSLAEVIKYGIIWDQAFFSYLERMIEKALAGNATVLEHIVRTSSIIKARVVERDERETTGLRAILNFGHTFGHGFEAAGNYTAITHGEAVALGIIAAARLARTCSMFSARGCERIEQLINRIGLKRSLRSYGITARRALYFMQFDKKRKNQKLSLVLPTTIGHVKVCSDINARKIRAAIMSLAK